ncbi:unnamed protein product [Cyprideis torosa]|uniref:Multiple inositol polyphosphate phosphatase 1 n=1 Tax=Cyprideis torosa TaxID=163714 RepID=A0A7R8WG65_9CRUS|nr:unnamed protein product [Cyprideis torosa]CAG0891434.1 unnamed protein product [Cyprideis torosa]
MYSVVILLLLGFVRGIEEGSLPLDTFGQLTRYSLVADLKESNWEKDCPVISVWGFMRHASRFPGPRKAEYMLQNLPPLRDQIVQAASEGRGSISQADIEQLKNWSFAYNPKEHFPHMLTMSGEVETAQLGSMSQADIEQLKNWSFAYNPKEHFPHMLTMSGEVETAQLGKRMLKHLPKFLQNHENLDLATYHTPAQRTAASAETFINSLYGPEIAKNFPIHVTDNGDPVTRPYKNCTLWNSRVKNNRATFFEYNSFLHSEPEVAAAHERIRSTLGLNPEQFPEGHSLMLYELCGFELAWEPERISPWCAAFHEEDIRVFDYLQDLDFYYKDGPGQHLNYLITCESIVAILQQFHHAGLMGKLLARLGLFRQTKDLYLAKNYDRLGHDRTWRTSHLVPFSANLVFALHDCGQEKEPQVSLHLNEQLVLPPFCPSEPRGMCPLSAYYNYLHPGQCLFQQICSQAEFQWWSGTQIFAVVALLLASKYFQIW